MTSMRRGMWLAAVAVSVALAGCRQKELKTTIQADLENPPQADYEQAKARLQKLDSSVRIGRVIGVLPEETMAAIGDIDVKDFRRGDAMTFLGADDEPVATGVVVNIVDTTLHVRYTPVGQGGRRPYTGDLVIRFTNPTP